jgi:hypothetical protein
VTFIGKVLFKAAITAGKGKGENLPFKITQQILVRRMEGERREGENKNGKTSSSK